MRRRVARVELFEALVVAGDFLLDEAGVRAFEEFAEGVLGEEETQEDPEQLVETGELHGVERQADFGGAGVGDVGGNLAELKTLRAELFEAGQGLWRQKLHDLL